MNQDQCVTLNAAGQLIRVITMPNGEIREEVLEDIEGCPWQQGCVGLQSITGDAPDQIEYKQRHGIQARHYLTMVHPKDARWIVDRVHDRIAGKTVVEIGAGIGVLAIALAAFARHIYAIEADPMWGFAFSRWLYRAKPTNCTYILDRAENLVDLIRADVALVVTGSDEVALRDLASRFAPDVIMPWQDWNDGKAVVRSWGHW